MPTIPEPSTLIKCDDLITCFQAIYNFLFAILMAFSFLRFVYGAFKYILSGAGVYQKEEAKKIMQNSIIAIAIVLVIPPLLNLINPEIFSAKEMKIPKVEVQLPGPAAVIYEEWQEMPPAPTQPPTTTPEGVRILRIDSTKPVEPIKHDFVRLSSNAEYGSLVVKNFLKTLNWNLNQKENLNYECGLCYFEIAAAYRDKQKEGHYYNEDCHSKGSCVDLWLISPQFLSSLEEILLSCRDRAMNNILKEVLNTLRETGVRKMSIMVSNKACDKYKKEMSCWPNTTIYCEKNFGVSHDARGILIHVEPALPFNIIRR